MGPPQSKLNLRDDIWHPRWDIQKAPNYPIEEQLRHSEKWIVCSDSEANKSLARQHGADVKIISYQGSRREHVHV